MAADDVAPAPDDERFRALALVAVDAARSAGAQFADVRVAGGRGLVLRGGYQAGGDGGPAMDEPQLMLMVGYGVRAMVDGAWGFAGGYALTSDAITRVARSAVERARANRPQRPRSLELAPTPKIDDGRWATPIERDPFTVPIDEQTDLMLTALTNAMNVPSLRGLSCGLWWSRTDRVFASTDGSVCTQCLTLALPYALASAGTADPRSLANARVAGLRSGGYGYEALSGVDIKGDLRTAAQQAADDAKVLRPIKSAEVGRYDLVCSGAVMGAMLADTVSEAVNVERALGYRANQEGTSFAAPPSEVLGNTRVGSPLFTVRADRSRPHGWSTVGWDDEGVKPEDYTVVRDGVIVDYHTSRQTAVELAGWYHRNGVSVRSHGCASGTGQEMPRVELPNLTLEPGRDDVSVDDLIADTKRGFYLASYLSGNADQQLVSAQYSTDFRQVREIRNGKLGDRIEDLGFQFIATQFWKNIDAIGGPSSAVLRSQGTRWAGLAPLQLGESTISAVPCRVRQVNVLNLGRTA